jgi:hypothetical protein
MHHLIRLVLIAFSCLARAEERQEWVVQIHLHELGDSKSTITEAETALNRVFRILDAMACQMYNVCRLHGCACLGDSHWTWDSADYLDMFRYSDHMDVVHLSIYLVYDLQMRIMCLFLRNECYVRGVYTKRRRGSLSAEERRERGSVRRHHVVSTANTRIDRSVVNASCM